MSFSDELQHTLRTMGFVQLLLALVFLGGYVLALSGFTGPRGRRRAAVTALLAALGFAVVTPDWATGALMMVLAVGGVGLFVALVWSLDRLMAARSRPEPGPADPAEATPAAMWDSAAEPTSAEPSHEPTHAAHRPQQQQHASP